jgi:hypothetical protein
MGVVLDGGEVGVPGQFLHGAGIGTQLQQVRNNGLAQGYWVTRGRGRS